MVVLIKALQLIFSLSILVIFHEFGHFIAAKAFKTRVEKFYLFFNPWFSLFKFKKGETEYGIGWLPLGGYVKISGMIDESMDKEQMKLPPQPWEFRAKPSWQRLIIMLGGVFLNVVLAIGIYVIMLTAWGEEYLPTMEVNKYGIVVDTMGQQMGLMNGDRIQSIDGNVIDDFAKIPARLILDKVHAIQVIRDNKQIDVIIPDKFLGKLIKYKSTELIGVRIPCVVGEISPGSGAMKSGMKVDDRLIGINEFKTPYYDQFKEKIVLFKNKQVDLHLLRGIDTVVLPVSVNDKGFIGIRNKTPDYYFTFSHRDYNFFEAIPAGFTKTFNGISDYLKSLKLLFSPEVKAYESVGGFITIAKIFPSVWDWEAFWRLTAFLSIMLAILNVLPIPALDGGHVIFLFYEMITGRKPSDKFLEYAQVAGMIFLFALLIFANGNDIIKLFRP